MITREENELLCRVENDAPMGRLMRQHWVPICLSEEVAEPDGDPVTRGGEAKWIGRVPGTEGQPHTTLKGGHFIQEDDPQGFVECILKVAKA